MRSQVAEVGCTCGGRPSSAGLCEDLPGFSRDEHGSENRTVPKKGPVFQQFLRGSHSPVVSEWKAPENEESHLGI